MIEVRSGVDKRYIQLFMCQAVLEYVIINPASACFIHSQVELTPFLLHVRLSAVADSWMV